MPWKSLTSGRPGGSTSRWSNSADGRISKFTEQGLLYPSSLSGGKFANGAATAAMAYAFASVGRQRAGRSLTENEIETFGEIFGDSLDYDSIRVNRRGFLTRFMKGQGIVTGNTINVSADIYQEDFALANLDLQAFFAHELTHVWQYQNVSSWTTLIAGSEHIRFRDPYGYSLDGRSFDQYRFEQQGDIVRDYYRFLHATNVSPQIIQRYEQVIYGPGGIKR